jgi:hypothetical protein
MQGREKRPWSDAGACPSVFPAGVRAFLALCRQLNDLTREFVRATARWTGARREQRLAAILQAVRYLTEQLDWMQPADIGRDGA